MWCKGMNEVLDFVVELLRYQKFVAIKEFIQLLQCYNRQSQQFCLSFVSVHHVHVSLVSTH